MNYMPELKSGLHLFDVMNLMIGAIVSADIYIAASFGAGLLGPASLLAGTSLIIIGIPIYIFYASKTEIETEAAS